MINSGLRGAERIEAVVISMKAYSYLDRGVRQLVVHQGIEDTLQIYAYRLKSGIEVRRRLPFAPDRGLRERTQSGVDEFN